MSEQQAQHTPGPWEYQSGAVYGYSKHLESYIKILKAHGAISPRERNDILKLAAAAPDLLQALEYLYREANANGMIDQEPSMVQAREAIQKAKGLPK